MVSKSVTLCLIHLFVDGMFKLDDDLNDVQKKLLTKKISKTFFKTLQEGLFDENICMAFFAIWKFIDELDELDELQKCLIKALLGLSLMENDDDDSSDNEESNNGTHTKGYVSKEERLLHSALKLWNCCKQKLESIQTSLEKMETIMSNNEVLSQLSMESSSLEEQMERMKEKKFFLQEKIASLSKNKTEQEKIIDGLSTKVELQRMMRGENQSSTIEEMLKNLKVSK